ncbi:MAG TPA: hydroxymethylbilane synthase [Pirellulales bacterium]|jgi:hydroxymethylbilane synthase|nr:hydroxymethylbilane synthase [Pirellulales bacterium]
MFSSRHFRIGTRVSPLALKQAEWVAHQLTVCGARVELVPITTEGDRVKNETIGSFGGPGVFTKELQRALVDGRIDVAVHSLKDLPTDPVDGLILAAVPPREEVADVLISRDRLTLDGLRQGAAVGTGSLRRQAQLLHVRPDLMVKGIRGNVDTRLRKVAEGDFDAIVLAAAGLRRLGRASEITQLLPYEIMLPAIGQGALGIEARADDSETFSLLARLDDAATHAAVVAERALLAQLRGGCLAPVAGWCRESTAGEIVLTGAVLSPDGREKLVHQESATPASAEALGRRVADALLAAGAAALIDQSRKTG